MINWIKILKKNIATKVSITCIFENNQVNMVFKPIYTLEVGYIIMIIMCKSWGYISIFTRFINFKKKKCNIFSILHLFTILRIYIITY